MNTNHPILQTFQITLREFFHRRMLWLLAMFMGLTLLLGNWFVAGFGNEAFRLYGHYHSLESELKFILSGKSNGFTATGSFKKQLTPDELQESARSNFFRWTSYGWLVATAPLSGIFCLLLGSMILDRYFRKGQIVLHLVRPVARGQLFFGKFLGLLVGNAGLLIALDALFFGLALGPFLPQALPIVMKVVLIQGFILLGTLPIVFLLSPLMPRLFRGGGAFMLSVFILILGLSAPVGEGFLGGLFPIWPQPGFSLRDKLVAGFASFLFLPAPHLSSAFRSVWEEDGLVFLRNLAWTGAFACLWILLASRVWRRKQL